MAVFQATLNQTAFLLSFILMGYLLSRMKIVPENTQAVLSKLENWVFIPALVLGTFISNFNVEKLSSAWALLLSCIALEVVVIALALVCVRICTKSKYEQNIYLYGLCFSNFGFVGNAVVSAIFPEIFLEYLIFTLPLWALIYVWGVPVLLMGDAGEKVSIKARLKNFVNPMFICMLLGMVIGLANIPVPAFINSAVTSAGNCMSPIAMLLTGMTIAKSRLKEILNIKSVYAVSALRLLVFPMLFLAAMLVIPMQETFAVCALCSLAMPLGLNTIIIPSAYGKDTRVASGMALVSHILSCITIPVIFLLYNLVK
jgi:predicted permease